MSPHLLSDAARLAGSSLLRLQADDRLVALVRDGHDPAFTAVVDRYRSELLRYCTRIVGESRAEDVVQQAFLNAHTAMTSSRSEIRLRPWLYRIAHNAGLNVLRSSPQQVELDDRYPSTGGLEQDVEDRERLQAAFAAIALLPEPQRDALTLQALEGRSHEEIASALGVSSSAARQHVHRARTTIRAAVSAITPYGLLARYAMAGSGEPTRAAVLGGAGAGLGATAVKVGAGVLAAGAIAGGTGAIPLADLHQSSAAPAGAARIGTAGRANARADRGVSPAHLGEERLSPVGVGAQDNRGHGAPGSRDGAVGRRSTGSSPTAAHRDGHRFERTGERPGGSQRGSGDDRPGASPAAGGGPGESHSGSSSDSARTGSDGAGSGSAASSGGDSGSSDSGTSGSTSSDSRRDAISSSGSSGSELSGGSDPVLVATSGSSGSGSSGSGLPEADH